ncbi:MAG: glycosyltransferase [Terriglobia bacterium]
MAANDGRISVLHFTNSSLWGGVEGHVCGLLCNLSRSTFRVHLVCDPALYERFRQAIPADIAITPLVLSSPKHLASALRFARLLRREQPQVVHSHMFWSSLFASPIAWACRVPVTVETLHGTEAWRKGWKANYMLDRAMTYFVSRYVAVCESDARFLRTKKRIPAREISVIHNGVDKRRFGVREGARNAIRHSLGFSETDVVLIVVARFHTGKGHRVLLDAMQRLLRPYPQLKLICLGEGERETELRALCEQRGLFGCVRFEGYQQNVAEWLSAADINVLPTFYEGFPLTVLEAMASGLPTVASNVGGISEAIRHDIEGLLVPPGNSSDLADALALLLGSAVRRVEMGGAALRRLDDHFLLDQQVRCTEKMYLHLSGRGIMPTLASRTNSTPVYRTRL